MRNIDIFSQYWGADWIILLSTVCLFFFFYIRFHFTYWKRKGIFSVPGSFPFGSIGDFILARRNIGEVFAEIYNKGKGRDYVGYYSFGSPAILLRDCELIKRVLVKDFHNFADRGMYHDAKNDSLSEIMFALEETKWKYVRTKVSSSFTSGKIKFMFSAMKACTNQLRDYLLSDPCGDRIVDIKDIITKYGVNVIATVAAGVEGHNYKENSDFSRITAKVTEPTTIQSLRFTLTVISKTVAKLFKLRFTPKEVEEYFLDITEKIISHREKNNVEMNDLMQLLINLKNEEEIPAKSGEEIPYPMTVKAIAAHIFQFILAGYETLTVSLCCVLYELALHKEIQEKVLAEIDSIDSDITYEKLKELNYLEMVLEETWRKYPPAPILIRQCKDDYTLPDGAVIPANTALTVSLYGMQNDPQYFPDPEKFDPERFNKSAPTHTIQPFSYLPFGEGPRFCIGKRFALTHVKLSLFTLLKNFSIEPTERTVVPLELEPKTFMLNSRGGMWLRLVTRNKS